MMDFTVLLLHPMIVFLLLLQSHAGQLQVVGPSQPIVALNGDDTVLPCRLEPAIDASAMNLQWMRPELSPQFVFMRVNSQDVEANNHPSYRGRTSVSTENLKHGDLSLNISNVNVSDDGTYRCYVPSLSSGVLIELVVGAVSSPVISQMNINNIVVVLQCESKGWHPEPEVSWLDGEGHVLSAGHTETVRGPDGLYYVSSRVTVDEKHGNSFTCRVEQKKIHQTREMQIYISVVPQAWKWILIPVILSILLCAGLTVVCRCIKRR